MLMQLLLISLLVVILLHPKATINFHFAGDLAACVREVQHGIDVLLKHNNSNADGGVKPEELAQLKSMPLFIEETRKLILTQ